MGTQAATILDPKIWALQSHELAKTAAYDHRLRAALINIEQSTQTAAEINLTDDYLQASGALAETLIVQAGYRLASTLQRTTAP
jgi:hypothetical protein